MKLIFSIFLIFLLSACDCMCGNSDKSVEDISYGNFSSTNSDAEIPTNSEEEYQGE
jgi:hypothetical protein